jgi:SAM-dependent methyltransferase
MSYQYLKIAIESLLHRKQQLQWLIEQNVCAKKVASFGCGDAYEPLALMWALGASEAVGIDLDIEMAQDTLANMRQAVKTTLINLDCSIDVPEYVLVWRDNSVLNSLKRLLKEEYIKFFLRDITKSTGLQPDYYDIAFCEFVLYHIWFDQERENPRADTQSAIREMARVVRPGGKVAAFECVQFSDKPRVSFKELFRQAGLKEIYTKERVAESGSQERCLVGEYLLFDKPARRF